MGKGGGLPLGCRSFIGNISKTVWLKESMERGQEGAQPLGLDSFFFFDNISRSEEFLLGIFLI